MSIRTSEQCRHEAELWRRRGLEEPSARPPVMSTDGPSSVHIPHLTCIRSTQGESLATDRMVDITKQV